MNIHYRDRAEAGRVLARALANLRDWDHVVVLALPRGGVPVAEEVARALGAPLDVLVVRKIGLPGHSELAMGAIATGGVVVRNESVLMQFGVPEPTFRAAAAREREELQRREQSLRGHRSQPHLEDRTVILVDDGLATGATMRAAVLAVRQHHPRAVVVAVPTGALSSCDDLRALADQVVCPLESEAFFSVGQFYENFVQVSDEEVRQILERAAHAGPLTPGGSEHREVQIPAGNVRLEGSLALPPNPSGLVFFAHGSGSGRDSPRNRAVAKTLNAHGLGTLLFDLLTPGEERMDRNAGTLRFDIDFLADRLEAATEWSRSQPELMALPMGYFGASTGAAAALVAAARRGPEIRAIVSRGGRPDLAARALVQVTTPTLLIVGGADREVLALSRTAVSRMRCVTRLEVVQGATHLFEEHGALEHVAEVAGGWFHQYLAQPIEMTDFEDATERTANEREVR